MELESIPKRMTKERLTELLKSTFSGVLEKSTGAADFIRLVQLHKRLYPAPPVIREVIWLDDADLDPELTVE